MKKKVKLIQETLKKHQLDGWLFYDFRRSNNLALKILNIKEQQLLTRRFFYWVPAIGEPIKLVHAIESQQLDHLPGEKRIYKTWQDIEMRLQELLQGFNKVAMEYSPFNAIPYISKVDGGTLELVRRHSEVVSSADLLQEFIVWDDAKLKSHLAAAEVLDKTAGTTWNWIKRCLQQGLQITEYDVQRYILKEIHLHGCMTADSPICAVNANSANPHYCATLDQAVTLKKGDFILIDLWCKQATPGAVYADITRVGVAGNPTEKQQKIFSIVKRARDAATALVQQAFRNNQSIMGWQVDQHCRTLIEQSGYGQFFLHRTGHNIDEDDHGPGANIDNFETHDTRRLIPQTCFSIEPGIYLPGEFGVRLEYDLYIEASGNVLITGGIQDHITICW